MFFLYPVGVKGAVNFQARRRALHATKNAGPSGGNMIDLDRRTPTVGLAFWKALLYSLYQQRPARPVHDEARVKGSRFQAHAYEGP
jgi:hypothetical protein